MRITHGLNIGNFLHISFIGAVADWHSSSDYILLEPGFNSIH